MGEGGGRRGEGGRGVQEDGGYRRMGDADESFSSEGGRQGADGGERGGLEGGRDEWLGRDMCAGLLVVVD